MGRGRSAWGGRGDASGANDQQQLVPLLLAVQQTVGQQPEQAAADGGFFSAATLTDKPLEGLDLLVPPARQCHRLPGAALRASAVSGGTVSEQMRHKLKTPEGRAVYKLRKAIVEPVFGQSKEVRGASGASRSAGSCRARPSGP